jgi:hypothetical protein
MARKPSRIARTSAFWRREFCRVRT